MTTCTVDQVTPGPADIDSAHEALPHIKAYLAQHSQETVRLVVDDDQDEALEVPRPAVELLARILAHMAAGESVSLVPTHAELTTQQAADLLHVSRPFLIGLLEAGEIEYRTVGKHRRVKVESLRQYLRADDRRRRDAADELSALSQEMGLT
ncbi:helix-turn-helix domain-containing protein [Amycolatopsis acidicola]|uniref:Helix-turn-helix domain-containing protein n=1 Tax=Amycolatopsis acidicola TaxID=2596893 RepID=A0A5N0VKS9_9PSEU|nr:helix-turn-helix domain-containing protein [Amycolatopsis acidicola]KAA9166776.1 helix-turn-helix domain-containing protein [Amycolatopsis acidicola]